MTAATISTQCLATDKILDWWHILTWCFNQLKLAPYIWECLISGIFHFWGKFGGEGGCAIYAEMPCSLEITVHFKDLLMSSTCRNKRACSFQNQTRTTGGVHYEVPRNSGKGHLCVSLYFVQCTQCGIGGVCCTVPCNCGNMHCKSSMKETQTAVVWTCFLFIKSSQNYLARHTERR